MESLPNLQFASRLDWTDFGAILLDFRKDGGTFKKVPGSDVAQCVTPESLLSISTAAKYVRGANGLLTLATANTLQRHHDARGNPIGVVIEAGRTNLATNSDTLSDATWNGSTRGANAHMDAKGAVVMSRLIETTDNSAHEVLKSVTASAETVYSGSVFLRRGERKFAQVDFADSVITLPTVNIDLDLGTIVATTGSASWALESFGDGLYRVHGVVTTGAGASALAMRVRALNDAGTAVYTGDVTKGLYVGGLQIEAGAQPSSYIPATGSAAARAADAVRVLAATLADIKLVGGEGTLAVECYPVLGSPYPAMLRKASNDTGLHYVFTTVSGANLISTGRSWNAAFDASYDTSTTAAAFTKGSRAVSAYRWTNGRRRVCGINGITAGDDLTARSYPAISDAGDLYIGGGQYALEAPLCVSRVLIANRGLNDANLQNLFGA